MGGPGGSRAALAPVGGRPYALRSATLADVQAEVTSNTRRLELPPALAGAGRARRLVDAAIRARLPSEPAS
jgi:hypothetical protein